MINLSCATKKMQEIALYTRSSKATKASHHATPITAVKQNPTALKLIALGVFMAKNYLIAEERSAFGYA